MNLLHPRTWIQIGIEGERERERGKEDFMMCQHSLNLSLLSDRILHGISPAAASTGFPCVSARRVGDIYDHMQTARNERNGGNGRVTEEQ